MSTVAIMQPYMFPFAGYYQLVEAVDTFVFYDDVDFITRGWINRNNLLVQGEKHLFTVPVKKASQNRRINETDVDTNGKWLKKFFKTLRHVYGQHPFYKMTQNLVEQVFDELPCSIAHLASESVVCVTEEIEIETSFLWSSDLNISTDLGKAERLIAICKELDAISYVNAIGGKGLYDKSYFKNQGVDLLFLKPNLRRYQQHQTDQFVPGLSILDVLMNVKSNQVRDEVIKGYEFV